MGKSIVIVVIIEVNKGRANVVLFNVNYVRKIVIFDQDIYFKLPCDADSRILRSTNKLIKSSAISVETQRLMKKSEGTAPRLYSLPKVHNADVTLRPVVSAFGFPR